MALVGRRAVETWTAGAIALVGAIVSGESLTHDIGWNDTGPGSGYFPFRIGLLLVGAAMAIAVQQRRAAAPSAAFVTRDQLRRTLSVFLPTSALVAAMVPLGCYVPSALYLAWMMRRLGGYRWGVSAAAGAAVMTAFFVVFEIWFRVPLAKGPVEAALAVLTGRIG